MIVTVEKLISAGYLAVCFVIVALCLKAGERIFHFLKKELSAERWDELGSPATLWDVFASPNPKWRAMMRDRSYEHQCSPGANERIDRERRYIYRLFSIALVLGACLVFWVLIR